MPPDRLGRKKPPERSLESPLDRGTARDTLHAKICPECGAPVEGMRFCGACGTPVDGIPSAPEPVTTRLGHDEQAAILQDAIREFGALGWHEWTTRPTPYETSLRRKSGLFARQFMALWVEEDGSVWTNYVGEGGSLRGLADNFGQPPWNPTLVRSGPDPDA